MKIEWKIMEISFARHRCLILCLKLQTPWETTFLKICLINKTYEKLPSHQLSSSTIPAAFVFLFRPNQQRKITITTVFQQIASLDLQTLHIKDTLTASFYLRTCIALCDHKSDPINISHDNMFSISINSHSQHPSQFFRASVRSNPIAIRRGNCLAF